MKRRDYEALGARVCVPVRPYLEAALAVIDATTGSAAWEACVAKGLVPADWSESRGAGRLCTDCNGLGLVEGSDGNGFSTGMWGCSGCARSGSREWTPELVAALVADREGVAAVEALMREAVTRLAFVPDVRVGPARWSVAHAGEYYWHMYGGHRDAWLGKPPELWPLAGLVRKPPDAIERVLEIFDRGASRFKSQVRTDLAYELAWDALAEQGAPFYVAHANPFTPLVEIWSRGYVPAGWDGRELFLAAPPIAK